MTSERVLVLGGSGFIGRRIVDALRTRPGTSICVASRHPVTHAVDVERVGADATDGVALTSALRDCTAVVNCVTGNASTIVQSAGTLAQCLSRSGCRRLIHLSSMAVFGDIEGDVEDDAPLGGGEGWYAYAKRRAEEILAPLAAKMPLTLLRPGCVYGPGSPLWVTRFGHMLRQRRLGDLGAAGDGWSNLVHVDDVAKAVAASFAEKSDGIFVANLAAPDSPRWNEYLVSLALAIGAVPVRRVPDWQLSIDSRLLAVPLRLMERFAPCTATPALPPSLVRLFGQQRRLLSNRATHSLGVRWTPFPDGVESSARWFCEHCRGDGS